MKRLKIKITYENLEFCRKFLNKERYAGYTESWIPNQWDVENELFLHYPPPDLEEKCYGAWEEHYPSYEVASTEEFKKTFYTIEERLKNFKI